MREWRRLYKTVRWKRLREAQLRKAPLCQCEHHRGKDTGWPADVVDHITPHRGSRRLFFDANNLQSMNKACHDRFKQSQEAGGAGFLAGCDASGVPLSGSHHWHTDTP